MNNKRSFEEQEQHELKMLKLYEQDLIESKGKIPLPPIEQIIKELWP